MVGYNGKVNLIIRMFKNRKYLLIASLLLVVILIVFWFYYYTKNGQVQHENVDGKTTPVTIIETQKKIICTRTTRLENEPQYDRALSLIYQRVFEGIGTKYKYFPAELANCIKIIEEKTDISSDIEGYFILNNENIKHNYYPIVVSSRYQNADDVVIALLLVHEMNHVQQYINTQNGSAPLSCVDNEIESFLAQRDFWPLLNSEERQSLLSRYHSDESLHPQIEVLFSMLGTLSESKCDFIDFKCGATYIRNKLKKIITSNSYYKEQCDL